MKDTWALLSGCWGKIRVSLIRPVTAWLAKHISQPVAPEVTSPCTPELLRLWAPPSCPAGPLVPSSPPCPLPGNPPGPAVLASDGPTEPHGQEAVQHVRWDLPKVRLQGLKHSSSSLFIGSAERQASPEGYFSHAETSVNDGSEELPSSSSYFSPLTTERSTLTSSG